MPDLLTLRVSRPGRTSRLPLKTSSRPFLQLQQLRDQSPRRTTNSAVPPISPGWQIPSTRNGHLIGFQPLPTSSKRWTAPKLPSSSTAARSTPATGTDGCPGTRAVAGYSTSSWEGT